MKNIILTICIIGTLQPILVAGIALLWVLGFGIFEIIFFWNESIRDFFTEIREHYPLGKLFEIFPYLIHSMIGWFVLSIIGFFILSRKNRGVSNDFTNIDGDFE